MNTHSTLNCLIESGWLPWRGALLGSRLILAAAAALFAGATPAFAQDTPAVAQLSFTAGDLVVSTYGVEGGYQIVGGNVTGSGVGTTLVNGVPTYTGNQNLSATLTNGTPTLEPTSIDGVPTPISLVEFTPGVTTTASQVMTDTLPTTDSTLNGQTNFGIVGEYGSSSEANLQLSQNGQYLLIAGYQADASIAGAGSPGNFGYYNANPDSVDALAQSTDTAVPRVVAVIGASGVANITTQFNDIFSTNNPRSVWSANGSLLYVSGQGAGTNDEGIFTV